MLTESAAVCGFCRLRRIVDPRNASTVVRALIMLRSPLNFRELSEHDSAGEGVVVGAELAAFDRGPKTRAIETKENKAPTPPDKQPAVAQPTFPANPTEVE